MVMWQTVTIQVATDTERESVGHPPESEVFVQIGAVRIPTGVIAADPELAVRAFLDKILAK